MGQTVSGGAAGGAEIVTGWFLTARGTGIGIGIGN